MKDATTTGHPRARRVLRGVAVIAAVVVCGACAGRNRSPAEANHPWREQVARLTLRGAGEDGAAATRSALGVVIRPNAVAAPAVVQEWRATEARSASGRALTIAGSAAAAADGWAAFALKTAVAPARRAAPPTDARLAEGLAVFAVMDLPGQGWRAVEGHLTTPRRIDDRLLARFQAERGPAPRDGAPVFRLADGAWLGFVETDDRGADPVAVWFDPAPAAVAQPPSTQTARAVCLAPGEGERWPVVGLPPLGAAEARVEPDADVGAYRVSWTSGALSWEREVSGPHAATLRAEPGARGVLGLTLPASGLADGGPAACFRVVASSSVSSSAPSTPNFSIKSAAPSVPAAAESALAPAPPAEPEAEEDADLDAMLRAFEAVEEKADAPTAP